MRRIISYRPTLGETALLILSEVARATLETLYPHPYYHQFCHHANRRSFANAIRRLERRHLVGAAVGGGREGWHLTPEGERLVRRLKAKLAQVVAQRRWDRKWRIVIFDIPEKLRGRRDFLRKELREIGFHQLQKSVWVSPYPMVPEFSLIVSELALGKHFRLVVAENIEDDSDLRTVFFPAA